MTVEKLQTNLKALGYKLSQDGVWGPKTEAACKRFQAASGLLADGIVGPKTISALNKALSRAKISRGGFPSKVPIATMPIILRRAQELGHQVFLPGNGEDYRLWLYGIRSRSRTVDSFNDTLGAFWLEDGRIRHESWPGTTDPGEPYTTSPLNPSGCAILVEGQYLDTWSIDLHAGKYEALCQRSGPVRVYRDNNRDKCHDLDPDTVERGYFGINIHAATRIPGRETQKVGRYSAGCLVHSTESGFRAMMQLAHKQVALTGRKTFSCTLLNEW